VTCFGYFQPDLVGILSFHRTPKSQLLVNSSQLPGGLQRPTKIFTSVTAVNAMRLCQPYKLISKPPGISALSALPVKMDTFQACHPSAQVLQTAFPGLQSG
jgi:hypothetical protein